MKYMNIVRFCEDEKEKATWATGKLWDRYVIWKRMLLTMNNKAASDGSHEERGTEADSKVILITNEHRACLSCVAVFLWRRMVCDNLGYLTENF